MKKAILWIIGIVVVLVLVFASTGFYFINYALHSDRSNYDVDSIYTCYKARYPWQKEWLDSIQKNHCLRDTFVYNRDGLKMHAVYMPAQRMTTQTAVIVHGYKCFAEDMLYIGYLYNHDLQWNILLPDLVGHGQSEGNWIGMGWKDRNDVSQWAKVAHGIFLSDTIVVHGISMGAATTMCVAGDDEHSYVRGFVEDCGYTSVQDEFAGEIKNQFSLPAFPILYTTSLMNKIWHGWSFSEASPLKQVLKADKQKPMLFIHGGSDTYVPTSMVKPLYDAKFGRKELWIAPHSEHASSYRDHHEEYTKKVKDFLAKL